MRRPETNVSARPGYYAIPPSQIVPFSPDDQKLLANFSNMQAHPTLPLSMELNSFRFAEDYYIVPLSFELPPSAVRFDRKGDQQHLQLAAFYPKIAVAYTQIATIATDDHHTLQEFRASVGAQWTFLSDPDRKLQKDLDIQEYTDPEHNPMIPHTLVLKPGLVIYSIYNGYWFWGRPSVTDLWHDLRAVTREIRPDWDLSTPGLRESWNAGDLSRFHGWNKRDSVEASPAIAQKK